MAHESAAGGESGLLHEDAAAERMCTRIPEVTATLEQSLAPGGGMVEATETRGPN